MPGNRPRGDHRYARFLALAHTSNPDLAEARSDGETSSTFGAFDSSEEEAPDWTAIAEKASDPWSH